MEGELIMGKVGRLIDADVAFRFFKDQKVKETGAFSKGVNKGLNIAKAAMHNPDAIPSVDAVEVVRCKDCKHSDVWGAEKRIGCEASYSRVCLCFWKIKRVRDDDFCSCGERRNNA